MTKPSPGLGYTPNQFGRSMNDRKAIDMQMAKQKSENVKTKRKDSGTFEHETVAVADKVVC